MKRWVAPIFVSALLVGGIVIGQMRRPATQVSPDKVLRVVADSQRELSKLPMHLTRLSDAEEIRIGDSVNAALSHATARDHAEVETYVAQVGAKLVTRASRPLPYRFHYIASDTLVNAFAVPGGHVYIGAGLLAWCDSEDQLASILAHEIEHIDRHHAVERVQVEARLRNVPLGGLVALPVEIFQAGYRKEQELEADREGTILAYRAGYSPAGTIRLLEREQALEVGTEPQRSAADGPLSEVAKIPFDTLTGYFRSHPPANERIEAIRALIERERWSNLKPEQPLRLKVAPSRLQRRQ